MEMLLRTFAIACFLIRLVELNQFSFKRQAWQAISVASLVALSPSRPFRKHSSFSLGEVPSVFINPLSPFRPARKDSPSF